MKSFSKNTPKYSIAARLRQAGFSLVEVTVATGIAAFGIITLLGLLPSGMNMFRDAMNVTVSSQIAQRLIKEAVQTDYDLLVGVAPGGTPVAGVPVVKEIRYFTDEGVELPAADAAEAIFHAHMRVMPGTDLPTLSGVLENSSLATVTVQVALNPQNQDLPIIGGSTDPLAGTIDPATRIPFTTFTSHIAKIK
ncbi:Verru_Chthon cassette protein B [Phragmitibacter flavus]|uniref:Verru_Chthon cassette protein B n=1 Tax=Phragmitibacter flavus TaxID=2576071 RepID=A0A5R8KFB9_9BACT|nr:Verru_Chthon cassette protein B [Phragmitibacter flavus]TLD70967.1 Verru_Chthon cassette protein B [Phragmitibacter flavus]